MPPSFRFVKGAGCGREHAFVNRHQSAQLDDCGVRIHGSHNRLERLCRQQILHAHLNDTRGHLGTGGKNRGEVEVVREEHESVHARPRQNLVVTGRRCADRGPMNRLEAMLRQLINPFGRQVHVDEQFHGRTRRTSTSSARQAAYANAWVMSPASR